ncbi:MAG: hypothetical protein IJY39_13765 [Clostridia bacterium]|nr:hypothetical protein [Clostridia bacterium]
MKLTKKLIALLLAAVMAFSMLALVGCTPEDSETEAVNADNGQTKMVLALEPVNSQFITLSATPMLLSAKSGTLQQTLTATVLPATAANKEMDWTVEWADSSNTKSVTEYVTVTPKSAGSTTATVTCYKAFEGNIVITVTTRDSGFKAQCIATYVGKPTDIVFTSSVTPAADGYHVAPGGSYTFNVSLTNPFGSVGSQFDDIEVTVSAVGSVVLGYYEYYTSSGSTKWYDSSDTTVALSTIQDKLISASYQDGVLTVNALKAIEDYYGSMTRQDGGRTRAYSNAFRSYASDCYFTVTITEKTSGLSETIKIRFDNTAVASVSLDSSTLSF